MIFDGFILIPRQAIFDSFVFMAIVATALLVTLLILYRPVFGDDAREREGQMSDHGREPLLCSIGGIPYNKAHLDAKDAEITRLREALVEANIRAGKYSAGCDLCVPIEEENTSLRALVKELTTTVEEQTAMLKEYRAELEACRGALTKIAEWQGEIHMAGWYFHNIATDALEQPNA